MLHLSTNPSSSSPCRPQGSPQPSQDLLLAQALPVIDRVARSVGHQWRRGLDREELAAVGRSTLVSLLETYEQQRAPWVAYVAQRVRWAMIDAQRLHEHSRASAEHRARCPSQEVAAWAGETTGRRCEAVDQGPETVLLRRRAHRRLSHAIAALPPQERFLIEQHYFHGEPFQAIGKRLGITKGWTSRLHAKALQRMHRILAPTDSPEQPQTVKARQSPRERRLLEAA